jgi:hypothetical protein
MQLTINDSTTSGISLIDATASIQSLTDNLQLSANSTPCCGTTCTSSGTQPSWRITSMCSQYPSHALEIAKTSVCWSRGKSSGKIGIALTPSHVFHGGTISPAAFRCKGDMISCAASLTASSPSANVRQADVMR